MSNGEEGKAPNPTGAPVGAQNWLDCFVACINRLGWEWAPVCAWLCTKEYPDSFRATGLPEPPRPEPPTACRPPAWPPHWGWPPVAPPTPPPPATPPAISLSERIKDDIIAELEQVVEHRKQKERYLNPDHPQPHAAEAEERQAHDIEMQIEGKKTALKLIEKR